MLLSIIVPVYNVEKYLRRCVDSLLDQGEFTDYEIILVDDGSTDSSPEICEKYKATNVNVRVLHKENGGLSSARNAGIMSAKGDYIMFVDSDDYIKSDCLNGLGKTLIENQLDVIVYNFAYIYDEYKVINNVEWSKEYSKIVCGEKYLIENLKRNTMHMMACNKIYRKTLITDDEIYFREGFVHEDEEWTPRILRLSQRLKQVDDIIYGYYMRDGSISNNQKNRKPALDLLDNCKRLKSFIRSIDNIELRYLLENNVAMLSMSAFYKGNLVDKKEEVIEICRELHMSKKNEKKVKLLQTNAYVYMFVNSTLKRLNIFYQSIKKVPRKVIAVKSLLLNKLQKKLREYLILKKQRNRLENHSFSIISSSCNGGVITSELGEQFRTPTVNVWFEADDFVKMLERLKYYMSIPVEEIKNNFYPYPVGKIDDVKIYFMHYHSFDEAKEKWEERKQRINYDNLFFLMAERDGCTIDTIKKFDALPYEHKVIFTVNRYDELKAAVCVGEYISNNVVDVLTDFLGMASRKYDRLIDIVEWLNCK